MPSINIEKREGKVKTRNGRDGLIVEQEWYFRILADNLNQDRLTILNGTSGVPQYGVAYGPYNLFLQSADGDRLEDYPLFWDCTYILSNRFDEGKTLRRMVLSNLEILPSGFLGSKLGLRIMMKPCIMGYNSMQPRSITVYLLA